MTFPHNTVALDSRRRHAVRVSAALVSQRSDTLAAVFKAALEEAFTPPELSELILQSLLFDGYPCALEGFLVLKEISGENYHSEALSESYAPANIEEWRHRGEDLCRRIYGRNFEPLLLHVQGLSPTLKEWMLMEGYGRVLGRPALPIDLRELGIIAILTVKNLPRQLHSHLRGALHVGLTLSELEVGLRLCAEFTSPPHIESALNVWNNLNQKPGQK